MVQQFVAMPLGHGYTVEEQRTGAAEWGGIQLRAVPLRREVREREQQRWRRVTTGGVACLSAMHIVSESPVSMGLAPGGSIRQEIYKDERRVHCWDEPHGSRVFVHLLNSRDWLRVTG